MRWIVMCMALMASPAWAGWVRCPGTTSDTSTTDAVLVRGMNTCLRQTTATDPARVNGLACRDSIDVIFASDIAGSNYDATVQVYQCPNTGAAGSFTDCEKILTDGVDQTLTGNPIGNRDAIYTISPGWLAFDITNGSSRTLELQVICR